VASYAAIIHPISSQQWQALTSQRPGKEVEKMEPRKEVEKMEPGKDFGGCGARASGAARVARTELQEVEEWRGGRISPPVVDGESGDGEDQSSARTRRLGFLGPRSPGRSRGRRSRSRSPRLGFSVPVRQTTRKSTGEAEGGPGRA
jgi:hypothetical protein